MRANEFINEAILDPTGWGQTPYGTDIDYFGLRVKMHPSTFLKLALPLGSAETNPELEKHMGAGGKIAYPFLEIKIPPEWEDGVFEEAAKVVGHEGRNRMTVWLKMKGDDLVQVNLLPRGGMRRRDLNDNIIKALSQGLYSQRGNFVEGPLFSPETALDEAESYTAASKEIRTSLRQAGYKLLGSGADATVWAKKSGPVTKIIMPDDGQGAGLTGDTFMKFYEFCKEHSNLENLPKFSGTEAEVFEADGKDYIMVTMERLQPIPQGSFAEAIVWILSELATKNVTWDNAFKTMLNKNTWGSWNKFVNSMNSQEIIQRLKNLDRTYLEEIAVLFTLMKLLFHTGKINKIGWDLHTENAMMRGDTIVITDPWFTSKVE